MEENSNHFCFDELFEMVEAEKEWLSAEEVNERYEKGKQDALDLINYINKRFNEIGEKVESAIYLASFCDTWFGVSTDEICSTLGKEKRRATESFILELFS